MRLYGWIFENGAHYWYVQWTTTNNSLLGIILACHYIGSAVGAALGQISDSSDEGFRAWLVIIATFICLAFVFSCVLSGKRLLQCIYLRVKKDKETI